MAFACDEPGSGDRRALCSSALSLCELPPGQAAYPYHFHLGEEELVIVLAGTPTLRTPDGEREVDQGEVVFFPPASGAPTSRDQPLEGDGALSRRLDLWRARPRRLPQTPNKIAASSASEAAAYASCTSGRDAVDYWDGESPPG